MKNKLLTLAGALALLAVLGKFYAVPAMAQIRAALVKNIDEKGRIPYQQSLFVSCPVGGSFCDGFFPAVPAGKRLVVEHASANIYAPNGMNGAFLELGGNTYTAFSGRANSTPSLIAVNDSVLMYFDAGQSPFFRVVLSVVGTGGESYGATITGYLVDLTQ